MSRNPFALTRKKAPWFAAGTAAPAKKATASRRAPAVHKPFCPVTAIAGLTDLPAGARLVLPWPPTPLSPNSRLHHAQKARFVKAYRDECWALTLEAFGCAQRQIAKGVPVAVRLDFFPPDARARDDDNCEAAFKAGRDGVASALGVDDRNFIVTRRLRTETRGCVVMTFTEVPSL